MTMELNEFIKKALGDIVQGVRSARESLRDDIALCCHTDKTYNGYPSVTYQSAIRENKLQ